MSEPIPPEAAQAMRDAIAELTRLHKPSLCLTPDNCSTVATIRALELALARNTLDAGDSQSDHNGHGSQSVSDGETAPEPANLAKETK